MTTTRYFMARFAQAFGVIRRNQRMGDAASEIHLLREAEAYLGDEVWEKVEHIERLAVEYWNLRKLHKERTAVAERVLACETKLAAAHDIRAALLSATPLLDPAINDERVAILTMLEDRTRQRDEIVARARQIRRTYDGLKMKLTVISEEMSDPAQRQAAIDEVNGRLAAIKQEFVALKEERIKIGHEIDEGDAKLDVIERGQEVHKKVRREHASATFQTIGEVNKDLAILRAELGILDTRMRQLYSEIGRYVSRHINQDAHCAEAVKKHRHLVDVMRALRRSVALNHRLAGIS